MIVSTSASEGATQEQPQVNPLVQRQMPPLVHLYVDH